VRNFAPGEVVFTPLRQWTSPDTGARYPVHWRVATPVGGFDLRALLDAQELDSRASTGTVYWEGLAELLALAADGTLSGPLVKQVFEESDVTDVTQTARQTVLRKMRGARMGFFEPPVLGGKTVVFGPGGGGEWPGAAVDPRSGVMYVPTNQFPWVIHAPYLDLKSTADTVANVPGNALYQAECAECHHQQRQPQEEHRFRVWLDPHFWTRRVNLYIRSSLGYPRSVAAFWRTRFHFE
jgi:hypothetical protein